MISPSGLMKFALLLLITAAALEAVSQTRVWRSRSDLSCHQLTETPRIVWHDPAWLPAS